MKEITMRIKPSINWLFIFMPVTLALEHAGVPAPYVFFSAALAIVPIASLIVHATEQLATRTGDAIAGCSTQRSAMRRSSSSPSSHSRPGCSTWCAPR